MTQDKSDLQSDLDIPGKDLRLKRNLLRDLAAEALRDHISTGRIPEGTKLTERDVSHMLGISRMPVRDALMTLEAEGLVIRRSSGRYVIKLTEEDVWDLHEARRVLEREAAILATQNVNEENRAALYARQDELEEAIAGGDRHLCTKCDLALHRVIWRQANNRYLLELLESLLGVIFVLNDRVRAYADASPRDTLDEHRELVNCIASGDASGAGRAMEKHLSSALAESLVTFRLVDTSVANGSSELA